MTPEQIQINELTERVKRLEDEKFLFPQRLSQIEKKNINNVMFLNGTIQLNGSGAAEFPIPGATDNNPVFVQDYNGTSLATGIVSSDVTPGIMKLYLAGTANHYVRYIIFLTVEPNL